MPKEHVLRQHLQLPRQRWDPRQRPFKPSSRAQKEHVGSAENHLSRTKYSPSSTLHPDKSRHYTRGTNTTSKTRSLMTGATISDLTTPYIGISRKLITPVFRMARRLRFQNPDVDMLLRHVNTGLDRAIVEALIRAALRLLPHDGTPEGKIETQKLEMQKDKEARLAEGCFIDRMRKSGYQFLTETEQNELKLLPTPDVRFLQPVSIEGRLCHWIEYKNFFGFRDNPFLAKNTRKQLNKYVSCLGAGAVVYRLGFETDHILDTGIYSFREAEVLRFLEQVPADSRSCVG